MKNKILLTLSTAAFVIPLAFSCNKDSTCNIVKNHYKTYVHDHTNVDEYKDKSTSEILSELTKVNIAGVETYKFNNIDYTDDKLRSSWPAANHLGKTLKIAILAEDKNSKELKDIAKKLTYHWSFSNYHNINWWQNELGANSTLANLGLFVFDDLGKKGQDAFNGKIRESSLKYRPSVGTHTGANVFDYIDITCRNAAINNDKEEMNIAFNRLAQEIRDDGMEGFQKDGSFFQHGRQVQNVSYGKSVIRVGKTLYQLRDTNYKLPDEKMKILSDYILKGLRESTFKGYTNYNTVSREYCRPNNLDTQANGFDELKYFTEISNYSAKQETLDFLDSLKNRTNAVKEDTITYFPVAKIIVANIGHDKNHEGVYISYKASEPNLTNTECVNGENQLGINLAFGTNTCVMDHGDEYFNIAPVMDYSYMPGTTSITYKAENEEKSDDDTIVQYANNVYGDSLYESKLPFAARGNNYIYNDGVVDNVTFSMTRSCQRSRGYFTVTCFATKYGVVMVGSNFNYQKLDSDDEKAGDYKVASDNLHTTVDQYITNDEPSSSSAKTFKNHNDGNITYKILNNDQMEKTQFLKTIEKRDFTKDSWKRNNRDFKPSESTPEGSKNIATITIENSGEYSAYAYAIQPTIYANSKDFELITTHDSSQSENNCVHAIKLPDGKIAAAFYDNCSFTYNGKTYSPEGEVKFGKGAFKIFDN